MKEVTLIFASFLCLSLQAQNELRVETGFLSGKFYLGNQRISKKDFAKEVNKYFESSRLYRKHKSNRTVSFILLEGSAIFGTISLLSDDSITSGLSAISAGVILIAVLVPAINSSKNLEKAAQAYNSSEGNAFYISPSKSGIGLTLNF